MPTWATPRRALLRPLRRSSPHSRNGFSHSHHSIRSYLPARYKLRCSSVHHSTLPSRSPDIRKSNGRLPARRVVQWTGPPGTRQLRSLTFSCVTLPAPKPTPPPALVKSFFGPPGYASPRRADHPAYGFFAGLTISFPFILRCPMPQKTEHRKVNVPALAAVNSMVAGSPLRST